MVTLRLTLRLTDFVYIYLHCHIMEHQRNNYKMLIGYHFDPLDCESEHCDVARSSLDHAAEIMLHAAAMSLDQIFHASIVS